jgi:hypothetical protein
MAKAKKDHSETIGARAPGFSCSASEMPHEMFGDFLAASMIERDRPEAADG